MDKRVIWLCALVGSTVGGFVPEVWGGSAFGGMSLLLCFVGGCAGIWFGARLTG